MRQCQESTNLPIKIFGPETHITAVVPLALGLAKSALYPEFDSELHQVKVKKATSTGSLTGLVGEPLSAQPVTPEDHQIENFSSATRCIVYGMQQRAVQGAKPRVTRSGAMRLRRID